MPLKVKSTTRGAGVFIVSPIGSIDGHTHSVLADKVDEILAQDVAQQIGKQMVIPVPAALMIERDQEEVGPLEILEDRCRVRYTGHLITQRAR